MGAFVATNLLDKDLVCMLYSENATSAWQSIAPVVALLRHKLHTPAIWENFEYLAAMSSQFIEQHPSGTYPRTAHRMPIDDRLLERWKRQQQQQGVQYVS
jgi:hypothetical protein